MLYSRYVGTEYLFFLTDLERAEAEEDAAACFAEWSQDWQLLACCGENQYLLCYGNPFLGQDEAPINVLYVRFILLKLYCLV